MQQRCSAPVHAAFVMEQTLGHVTHYRNLRDAVQGRTDLAPSWLPIPFDLRGASRFVPLLRSNWSVRASWRARRALNGLSTLRAPQALDVVFFHSQVTALFSTSIMRQLPCVVSLDATPINYDSVGQYYGHRPAGSGRIDRWKYELNRKAFESAAALVTWSEWARRSLADDYGIDPSRVTVMAPGAAAAYFELGQARPPRPAPTDTDPVRVLFVGGDFRRKGGPLLIEALRGALGQRCELHLVTQERLPSSPGQHVHNGLGPNSAQLRQLFAEADIFVLPTHADCLPLVLMEAAASGLPVITTDVGAVSEAVLPGRSGLVVPTGDVASLAGAIGTLVDQPQLRRGMGQAGYALARQKFDAHRNNQLLIDLLIDVAHRRRATRRAA